MLVNRQVVFSHGIILTKEMLEETYEYPRKFLQLHYASYSDGILEGLDLVERQGDVWLTKGVFKRQDNFYFTQEDVNLTAFAKQEKLSPDRTRYSFCLTQEEHKVQEGITDGVLSLQIHDCSKEESLCMGGFSWAQEKLILPRIQEQSEKPFELFTRPSRMDVLEIPYAWKKEATYHPVVFRAVRSYLQEKPHKNCLDYVLLLQLQNQEILPLESLRLYVESVRGNVDSGMKRRELFEVFTQCLMNKKGQKLGEKSSKTYSEQTSNDSRLLD